MRGKLREKSHPPEAGTPPKGPGRAYPRHAMPASVSLAPCYERTRPCAAAKLLSRERPQEDAAEG